MQKSIWGLKKSGSPIYSSLPQWDDKAKFWLAAIVLVLPLIADLVGVRKISLVEMQMWLVGWLLLSLLGSLWGKVVHLESKQKKR